MTNLQGPQTGPALIALGGNLPFEGVAGPALLSRAVTALAAAGLAPLALSGVWETAPWPPVESLKDQPVFVNAALAADPGGRAPGAVYEILRAVEIAFGRERRVRWGARTLDLDLIGQGEAVLNGADGGIIVPHPRAHERAFVLAPLAEIAPDWRPPGQGRTVAALLAALPPGQTLRRLGSFPETAGLRIALPGRAD